MTEPIHDDERLSALLAGRLEGPERDELLAYLSTSDEDREVFASTAAILREMEEEDGPGEQPGVQAADSPRHWKLPPSLTERKRDRPRRPLRWAVTTALAGLAAYALYLAPGGEPAKTPAAAPGPVAYAAALQYPAGGKPAGWDPNVPGVSRDGEQAERTPEEAARAGILLVHLAVAVQTQDSAATVDLAGNLQSRFDPQGGVALRQVQSRAGEPRDAGLSSALERAEGRIEAQFDSSFVGLGGWTEAARMAAAGHDAAFFQSADSHVRLARAATLMAGDPRARAALASVRALLAAGGTPSWTVLEAALRELREAIVT